MLEFIFGILVIQVGFPLLDGITSLLLTMIEAAKGYFAAKVIKYNNQMRDENSETPKSIGFVYQEEEVPDEEIL